MALVRLVTKAIPRRTPTLVLVCSTQSLQPLSTATPKCLSVTPVSYTVRDASALGNPISRLWNRYFGGPSRRELAAYSISAYTSCGTGVDLLEFLETLEMEDSFYSWFLVTELHLWMVCVRLMNERRDVAEAIRNFMIEQLWRDCEQKIKKIIPLAGSAETKDLNQLSAELNMAILIYDNGLLGSDKELANAIWRRFFVMTPDPDYEKIEILVSYIRRTIHDMENRSIESLLSSKMDWLSLTETGDKRK